MVCTPEEAIDCFQRTRMDVLAIGPDELRAAVETARQQLLSRRAAVQAAIHQHIADGKRLSHGVRAVLTNALQDIERANNG